MMEGIPMGKPMAEGKGEAVSTDESTPSPLLPAGGDASALVPDGRPRQDSLPEALVHPIVERIAALEKELSDRLALFDENRRLAEELRLRDREITQKNHEVETLKRDLVYQKKLLEKEIEDRMRVLDERRTLMDREFTERITRERDEFERRLAAEKDAWSDRLAREQEKHAASLAEIQTREGFWSRLGKMLTWS
ncbi:MAG: hypothetical protein ABFD97_19780 [Syntrophobacter sp.]